jgi:BirA family biotin operon repressor/biotin-[acetyl-CoA-carboxylase] ligase
MGINVNQTEEDFPPEIRERAGSLRMDAGRPLDRTEVLIRLLLRLDEEYAALVAGGEQTLIETYESLCPMARGRQVTVSGESETLTGQTAGLTAQGALRVSGPTGMREIVAGEVSVAESGDVDRR